MGRLVHKDGLIYRAWNFFFNLSHEFHGERIIFSYGDYLVKIQTPMKPKRIWLSMLSDKLSVCQGQLTYVAAKVQEDGFLIKATIRTNECQVDWFIE